MRRRIALALHRLANLIYQRPRQKPKQRPITISDVADIIRRAYGPAAQPPRMPTEMRKMFSHDFFPKHAPPGPKPIEYDAAQHLPEGAR